MVRATVDRNRRLRERRANGQSTRQLAKAFRLSQMQVRRILADTGGDPLAGTMADLAKMTDEQLEREAQMREDRIASDRRRLRLLREELQVRADSALVDRLTGVAC
jgi:transcriptional regulator with XRE-family HTH domain